MGSGFSKMKKQARLLEEQFGKMREEAKNLSVEGCSGNGLVSIVLNGEWEMQDIRIKPECVDPEDVEGLQDLIKAAYEDAAKKLNDQSSSSLPPGLNLPIGL